VMQNKQQSSISERDKLTSRPGSGPRA
jgi:hypothetical protein